MSLTILGTHGSDVWVETDGDLYALTPLDLRWMRVDVYLHGATERWRHTFDEADVTALIQALDGPQLDDCRDCEQPGLIEIEGRMVCPGHAYGYGIAEQESEGER